jgi:hypothetical protein
MSFPDLVKVLDRLFEFLGSNYGAAHALVDFGLFHPRRFTHSMALEEWKEKIQGI